MNQYDINDWLDYELYEKGSIARDLKFFTEKFERAERIVRSYSQAQEDWGRGWDENDKHYRMFEDNRRMQDDFHYRDCHAKYREYKEEIKWIKKQIEVNVD